jgi:glycine/D-amino acid oxidase-like deaminating enzyme
MTEQRFDLKQKDGIMDRSWMFFWDKGVDYMIFRQGEHRTGALFLGGGLSHASDDGLDSVGEPSDDDQTIPVKAYLSGLLPSLFAGSKNTEILSTWTGILGWSADLIPWVGPIPSSVSGRDTIPENGNKKETDAAWVQVDGREWISAGYSGEGMTLAWKCGKAVAYMILGLDKQYKVQDWLPEQYLITAKRVKDADVRKLKELY